MFLRHNSLEKNLRICLTGILILWYLASAYYLSIYYAMPDGAPGLYIVSFAIVFSCIFIISFGVYKLIKFFFKRNFLYQYFVIVSLILCNAYLSLSVYSDLANAAGSETCQ